MHSAARGKLRPGPRDIRRNPLTCALVTVALATTFWLGLIWLAQQIRP